VQQERMPVNGERIAFEDTAATGCELCEFAGGLELPSRVITDPNSRAIRSGFPVTVRARFGTTVGMASAVCLCPR